jgi:uncharacterized protein YaiE (UPF0345 family)
MIARLWHGRTKPEDAELYAEYVKATGIKAFKSTPGNRGSLILQQRGHEATDIYVLSLWASMDAVRSFAGPTPDKPVYFPADRRYLLEFEPAVRHFDVPVHDGGAAHNIHFDGRVQSLSLVTPDGPATLGVFRPGQFTFTAEVKERVRVLSGELVVRLPGQEWTRVAAGDAYVIPAGTTFDVEARVDVGYLCVYETLP